MSLVSLKFSLYYSSIVSMLFLIIRCLGTFVLLALCVAHIKREPDRSDSLKYASANTYPNSYVYYTTDKENMQAKYILSTTSFELINLGESLSANMQVKYIDTVSPSAQISHDESRWRQRKGLRLSRNPSLSSRRLGEMLLSPSLAHVGISDNSTRG